MLRYRLKKFESENKLLALEKYFLNSSFKTKVSVNIKKQTILISENRYEKKEDILNLIQNFLKENTLFFDKEGNLFRKTLFIKGLDCRKRGLDFVKNLKEKYDIESISLNLEDGTFYFTTLCDELKKNYLEVFQKEIQMILPEASLFESENTTLKKAKINKKMIRIFLYALGFALFTTGFILDILEDKGFLFTGDKNHFYLLLFYIPAYICFGYKVIYKAFKDLFSLKPLSETFLILVATSSAFVINHYSEAVLVVLLYELGEYIQDLVFIRAAGAIESAHEFNVKNANLVENDKVTETSVFHIEKGDLIFLKQGETLAFDAVVIDGIGSIDTKKITGEVNINAISKGLTVYSGSTLVEGGVTLKVINTFKNSFSSKIQKMVDESTQQKSRTENILAKFSSVYTPLVCVLAIIISLSFLYVHFLGFNNLSWQKSLYNGLVFLVASCPCALIISIPIAFYSGIVRLSKNGVLVKETESLDRLSKIKRIAFDKTGTLTKGSFKLKSVENYFDLDTLKYAAIAEKFSTHPIAMAIKRESNIDLDSLDIKLSKKNKTTFPCVLYENKEVRIGSFSSYKDASLTDRDAFYVNVDGKIIGKINLEDEVKNNASELLEYFSKEKINTFVFTGDSKKNAETLKEKLNFTKVYSEMTPLDKQTAVEKLGKNTAFIGDGVNDALAIKNAYLGLSMGSIGSDVSVSASKIVFLDDRLDKVSLSHKVAKNVKTTIIINIIFTLLIKLLVLVLATFGKIYMWLSIFADVGVAIIATLYALNCLGVKNVFNRKNYRNTRHRGRCCCHEHE